MRSRSTKWAALAKSGQFGMDTIASIGTKTYTAISAPSIEYAVFGDKPSVGNCAVGSMRVSVLTSDAISAGQSVVIKARLTGDSAEESTEFLEFGTFYIDTREANNGLLTLSCYDAMLKASQQYADPTKPDDRIGWPKTMAACVSEIAARIGVSVDDRTTIKTTAPYQVSYPNKLTMIQVLGYIGAAHGGNWIITPENKLRLVPLAAPAAQDADGTETENTVNVPVVIGKITTGHPITISRVTIDRDADLGYTCGNDTGIEIRIDDNPYACQAICDDLYTALAGLSYAPYAIQSACCDPCVEIGDTIVVGDQIRSVACAIKSSLDTDYRVDISAPGENEASSEYPYLTEIQRLHQTDTRLQKYMEDTKDEIDSQILQTRESILLEVSGKYTVKSLTITLSRDNAVVFVNTSGTPDLSAASVTLTCTLGGVDQTDAAELTFAPVGLTGSYDDATHIYTVTAMTATTGYVTITAAYDGQTASRRFTVVQVRNGTDGTDGKDGTDGISVTAMTAHYAASSSGDTAPTDGWSDTMPERDDTQYLWGYYTVTFSDGTTHDTVPYVVAGAGETYTELTNQLQTVVHEYNTKIDQTKAEILQTASETYATAESFSKLETKVEQTAQQIEFRFSDANGRIQDVSDALSSNQKLLEEYIRFKGALMELGRSDSDFIAKLSNERLSFYEGSNEIAYISNNALNITDAQIRRRLSISYVDDSGEIKYTYDWIVRSNGHITLARRR